MLKVYGCVSLRREKKKKRIQEWPRGRPSGRSYTYCIAAEDRPRAVLCASSHSARFRRTKRKKGNNVKRSRSIPAAGNWVTRDVPFYLAASSLIGYGTWRCSAALFKKNARTINSAPDHAPIRTRDLTRRVPASQPAATRV